MTRLHVGNVVRWLFTVGLLTLAACGAPASPGAGGSPNVSATSGASPAGDGGAAATDTPTTDRGLSGAAGGQTSRVRFQFFGDAVEGAVYQKIADTYMAAHPGRVVELINVPSQGDHLTRLTSAFTAGDPPEVFLINYRRYGQFVQSGVLEPVGPWMSKSNVSEAEYYPIALDAFRANGVVQCLPQNISSPVVYFNKTLFEQQGVPLPQSGWTWQEFLQTARRMTLDTNGDGLADVYGLGVEPELIRLAPFIWQGGGNLVDDPQRPTRFTLDDPKTQRAIDFFISLRARYGVVPTEAEYKAEDNETRFRNGKLAMAINSRRVVPSFREIKDFTWDVAGLPSDEASASVLHSDAYCIARATKDKSAAWDFVRYIGGPEGQQQAAELGRTVPSLKRIAESPAFLDPARPPASSQIFLDALPDIRVLPVVPTWPQIENAFNQEFEVAFYANDEAEEQAGGGGEEQEIFGAERALGPGVQTVIEQSLQRAAAAGDEALRKANAP